MVNLASPKDEYWTKVEELLLKFIANHGVETQLLSPNLTEAVTK